MRNLASALIEHGRIRTTDTKAKVLRPYVERLITMAKKDTVHARRLVTKKVRGNEAVQKLFGEYAPRFKERAGGYTRIIKEGRRPGDNAPMSFIEFLGYENEGAGSEEE